jgi:hypothetical protein
MEERILNNIPGMSSAQHVFSIEADELTKESFYKNFVSQNKPCLIKNAIAHWPAMAKWKDSEYLKSKCGQSHSNYYPHMNYDDENNMLKDETNLPFSKILDLLQAHSSDVISAPSILLERPPYNILKHDMKGFNFNPAPASPLAYPTSRAFFYKNAGTGWHYHFVDETLMCQVKGSKKVGLLPPDKITDDIVYDIFTTDAYLKDDACFNEEDSHKLTPTFANVEPGDALYIPPFWWHGVEPINEEFGITVANCWRSPLHVMGDLSYPTVRKIWKKTFIKPNKNTPYVFVFGTLSILAQASRIIQSTFKRNA